MNTPETPTTFRSSRAPEPVGLYPHARRKGSLVFLSGIGPREVGKVAIPGVGIDANGNPYTSDFAAQCASTFENVRFVLEEAGSSWDELIDVTVFLTDMAADFATFNAMWAEAFPNPETCPCRTTVQVGALPTPIAIELKCIATIELPG